MLMSSWEIQSQIITSPSNRVATEKEEGIVFATDTTKSKTTKVKPVYFVRFRIGSLAAKKAGIKAGDIVDVKFDAVSRVGHIVKGDRGWKTTGMKRNKNDESDIEALQVRYTWHKGLPSIPEAMLCKGVHVLQGKERGTIHFTYPEATAFIELAPQKNAIKDTNADYQRRATDHSGKHA